MRRTPLIAIIGTATILLTGCGDDTAEISKADFIEQANAMCRQTQDEMDPVWETVWDEFEDVDLDDPVTQESAFVAFADAMAVAAPAMHDMADDLRALGAPEGDEELIERLLDDLDAAVDEFAVLVDAAAAGDEAARDYFDGEGGDAAIDLVNRRARDYGLDVCGAGS